MSKPKGSKSSEADPSLRTDVGTAPMILATTPEEIPPTHVLVAAQDEERREAEELLAGFDRPVRSPRRRPEGARDFVDHFAGREVTRTPPPGAVSGKMVIRPVLPVEAPNTFRTRLALVVATTLAIVLGMGAYVWMQSEAREDAQPSTPEAPAVARSLEVDEPGKVPATKAPEVSPVTEPSIPVREPRPEASAAPTPPPSTPAPLRPVKPRSSSEIPKAPPTKPADEARDLTRTL